MKNDDFCATDLHADMVKRLLDEAFIDLYNGEYNQAAVAKITGQSDKVGQLIRQYKTNVTQTSPLQSIC